MIKISNLEGIADDPNKPSRLRRIAHAFAKAINDWPTPNLVSLDAYITELRVEIGELSEQNIRARLVDYSPESDAWKMESLTGLLSAWDTADTITLLDDLVAELRESTSA